MLRLSALMLAVGLSVVAVGCAHCDTCDDFPSPCSGPNCPGGQGMPMGPGATSYTGPSGSMGTTTEVLPPPSSPAAPVAGGGSIPPAPTVKPPVESKPATGGAGRSGF